MQRFIDETVLLLEGVNGPGDSGSPALVDTDSGLQIMGVSSGGRYEDDSGHAFSHQGKYGWQEFYIRVSQMRTWIDQVLRQND